MENEGLPAGFIVLGFLNFYNLARNLLQSFYRETDKKIYSLPEFSDRVTTNA